MSQRIKAENSPGSRGASAQARAARPDPTLAAYRAAADDLVEEALRYPGPSDTAAVADLVAKRLAEPEFTAVLSRVDGGADAATDRVAGDLRGYQPSTRRSASDFPTFVRILLLSQIDSAWWGGTAAFRSDPEVLGSAELVDLRPLRSAGVLEFRYRAQPSGLAGRARDRALHKVLAGVRPRVAGLRFTRSRPVVIAAVNRVARAFAAGQPGGSPRPWVTSMVRSVDHQHRLRALGYSAVLPSSHCAGYACDLEKTWFRRFDPGNALARVLLEHQEAGQLNVIDEGHAWHLCVSPQSCGELQAAYDSQLRGR
jgi:hypothetical protein